MTEAALAGIEEGTRISFRHLIRAEDIDAFAALSGDRHELHMDAEYARSRGYRDRVVHGAYLLGLASRLVGMELPARHVTLLSLNLQFALPSYPGDEVAVSGLVVGVHPSAGAITLRIEVECAGELRARGMAMVRVQDAA